MKIYKIVGSNEDGTRTSHYEPTATDANARKKAMKNDRVWKTVKIETMDVQPNRAGIAAALNLINNDA